MTILVLAELSDPALSEATARAVTAASRIGGDIHLLVVGAGVAAAATEAAALTGVARVRVADDAALAHARPEALSALIASLAADYDVFLAPATSTGKSVMPRVAALLDVMQISDITAVTPEGGFERPIYAGSALQVVRPLTAKAVVTVRLAAFEPAAAGGAALVEAVAVPALPAGARFLEATVTTSERPDLTSAGIVVSGGRALGSAEKFSEVLFPLADKLGAAVGASRAAVDSGYAPNDLQVGQTGKVVAPNLYVALGISGAIQHLAGMKDSRTIVAINKDPDAPIFQVADYGLVGDLFELVPELVREL